jgi:hypothetical protein
MAVTALVLRALSRESAHAPAREAAQEEKRERRDA